MYTNEDFERHYIRYKTEWFPRGESLEGYCFRRHNPYNLLDKWVCDTRHKLVPVQVAGRPGEAGKGAPEQPKAGAKAPGAQAGEAPSGAAESAAKEETRILLEIKTTDGLHLRRGGLTYAAMKALVELPTATRRNKFGDAPACWGFSKRPSPSNFPVVLWPQIFLEVEFVF